MFLRHTQLFLWKNSLQKARNPGQTCCELLTPVILVALFALLCVIYAWAVLGQWSAVHAGIGDSGAWLLLVGGVFYTVGAVIYALKRPDPFPATFGYHEIFHALVIAGAVCHFFIVKALVLPT